ncbi:YdcF family protein [Flammeovirgaceae bacterium SG7u.111]|nr:YdcF family protein [Flammeovirgaceae bacterium SG7u.132]WPO36725.1 YdcF family protein [Flammeovirgaceae bacterium SG7u.111]
MTPNQFEVLARTYCDHLPASPADGVFLVGQTPSNQESVLKKGAELVKNGHAKKILLLDCGAVSGYPGVDVWLEELKALGMSDEQLEPIPHSDPNMIHTRLEAGSLMAHAKAKEYRSIIICSPSFHQPRSFMTAITMALEEYPEVKVYSQAGDYLPWTESAIHSQGKAAGTRVDILHGELERIYKYQGFGDLASFEAVLEYLNRREGWPN